MSSSSDCAEKTSPQRRTSTSKAQEQAEGPLADGRRSSKYDIYGSATKPFGESYRRSQSQTQLTGQPSEYESEESPVETFGVEATEMGCKTSRTQVVDQVARGSVRPVGGAENFVEKNKVTNNATGIVIKNDFKKLSDYEIVYGVEKDTCTNNNNAQSVSDIYTEVKKEPTAVNTTDGQTPREKLMQQIRERREDVHESGEHIKNLDDQIENFKENEISLRNKIQEEERQGMSVEKDVKHTKTVTGMDPVSFVEEEYSYEPERKESTSKLVVRSRSLMNLESNLTNDIESPKRPNALKITTKPDGTIRYGNRQGYGSESDLIDSDESPVKECEIKSNYVSAIKSAFDAAIEKHNENNVKRAEAFDGLRKYFHDNKHGLQELLINNNVVIIEPFRHDTLRRESETSDGKRSCRITGATIKSPVSEQSKTLTSNTLPRSYSQQNARQGFYHPIKSNKELIDAELPDPDKVKTAREWFEKIFKSRSSSEIPSKKSHNSFFNTISGRLRVTPEVKVNQDGKPVTDKRRQGRLMIDDMKRYPNHRKWTDSGSLSSGVSSDFSCDQDCDFHHLDSSQEILEEYSTEDEDAEYYYQYDEDDTHPVSSEVLQKIRACGTTVTYYGGKVISRSHGQFRSPLTMTIMDEIRQCCGTTEGRKKFESDAEAPYLGVKFKLVKSNSCGSRLEIAGTDEYSSQKLISPRHESFRGETIAEEVAELKEDEELMMTDNELDSQPTSMELEEDKAEADRYVTNVEVNSSNGPQTMTWAELKLKEARKQWHYTPEAVRIPAQDMEFESFEVMDDPTNHSHKSEKPETGRG